MLDDRSVRIKDGAARLNDGTLAGSALTMERALYHACRATSRSLRETWIASSLNAARAISISNRKSNLESSGDADLVLLDEEFHICLTAGRLFLIASDSFIVLFVFEEENL